MSALIRRIFSGNNLFMTNVGVSFALSGLGDVIEQKLEKRNKAVSGLASKPQPQQINWRRTLHMSTSFGLTSGLLCHYWYNWLDRALPGRGVRIVLQKIAWDQVLFSPVCIGSCLLVAGRLEDRSPASLLNYTVQVGGQLYLAEWIIWPPAQFVNFYFLPTRFRVLYDNIISLVYDTYTSHVKYNHQVVENFDEKLVNSGFLPHSESYRTVLDCDQLNYCNES